MKSTQERARLADENERMQSEVQRRQHSLAEIEREIEVRPTLRLQSQRWPVCAHELQHCSRAATEWRNALQASRLRRANETAAAGATGAALPAAARPAPLLLRCPRRKR